MLVVAVGCGTPAAVPAPTLSAIPTASVTATLPAPTASLPRHIAGTSVGLTLNGATLTQEGSTQIDGDGPALVVITFPVAMNRTSVERFVPRSASITWTDDRTLSLSIPATESLPAFKVAESTSEDGSAILDIFFVNLAPSPALVVSLFSVDELLAGAQPPTASAVRVPSRAEVLRFSPDGRKVLLYQARDLRVGDSAPRIFDPASRSSIVVAAPVKGPLLLGAWAGNDRVVLVGDSVWTAARDGTGVRTVTELRGLAAPKTAALSAVGNYLVLGWPDKVAILDLRLGSMRFISDHHDECDLPIDPLARFAWSQDETRLATLECAASAPTPNVRITDLVSGRIVTTIEGGDLGVVSLLSGDFAIVRDSGEQGEGSRRLFIVYSFDGTEKARYLGYAISASPNGRYLLDGSCCAGEGSALTDLAAPGQKVGFGGSATWLRDGRVVVSMRPGGSRARVLP
jgi:hypothetical protein